jgi:NAD-dependent SIR2 family protein deacetylase
MTIRIYCERCGFIFYRGDELTNPQEIIKKYGGKCPRCYKPLQLNPKNIKIMGVEEGR